MFLTALGTLGLSGSGLLFRTMHTSADEKKLAKWLKAIGTRRQSTFFLADRALETAHEEAFASWKHIGYKALDGSGYYTLDNGKIVLFPLSLHNNEYGTITTALLCFEKRENGSWATLNPLSGFQLEALYKATEDLGNALESSLLGQYLLPAYSPKKLQEGYPTKKGIVVIHCNANKNERQVFAKILGQGKEIWSSNYESNLLLS